MMEVSHGRSSKPLNIRYTLLTALLLDLGLSQILPMLDEETGAEPRIVSASIADPYLLLIRDDSSAFIAHIDSNNELEELEKESGPLTSTKWLTGCLYADKSGLFSEGDGPAENIIMFLLSSAGSLSVSLFP